MRYGSLNGGGTKDDHEDGPDSGPRLLCKRRVAVFVAAPLLVAGTLLACISLVLPEKRGGDVARTELGFDLLTAAYHARARMSTFSTLIQPILGSGPGGLRLFNG